MAKRIYELLNAEDARHIDDILETAGLNSGAVLATLSELRIKRDREAIAGKTVP
jgi:hypothetical protein